MPERRRGGIEDSDYRESAAYATPGRGPGAILLTKKVKWLLEMLRAVLHVPNGQRQEWTPSALVESAA